MTGTLNEQQIDDLLMGQTIGRIGCHSGGKTVVVPITYAFDGSRIIGHCSEGEKIAFMRSNPSVCFEVDDIQNLHEWRSVVLQARYQELWGDESSVALSYFVENVVPQIPHAVSVATLRPEVAPTESETIVFALEVTEKSGRFETVKVRVKK